MDGWIYAAVAVVVAAAKFVASPAVRLVGGVADEEEWWGRAVESAEFVVEE